MFFLFERGTFASLRILETSLDPFIPIGLILSPVSIVLNETSPLIFDFSMKIRDFENLFGSTVTRRAVN